jgi:hypothetical protein
MASCSCWGLYRWWVDHWFTDVSWVWRMPNRNAAALLLNNNNIRNNRFLHHQGGIDDWWVLHQNSWCQTCYTESPKYNSAPSYITREPEYYTEAPHYYNTERSSTTLQPTQPRATTPTSRSITVRKRKRLKKRSLARTAEPYLSPTAFLIV